MTLKNRIDSDLKKALKSSDKVTLSVLRLLKAEVKNREIAVGSELDDDGIVDAISSAVKKGRESMRLYEQGQRAELAEKEAGEIEVMLKYLPEQMSEKELRKKVSDVIAGMESPDMKQMGQIMKAVMASVGKSADGKTVNKIVKELLSGGG